MQARDEEAEAGAFYFLASHGHRCAMLFFDLENTSDISVIAEPLFAALHAEIELMPVMNLEELQKGLAAAS